MPANQTIQIHRSVSPGNVPSSLDYGELAINIADQVLFVGDDAGGIVSFQIGTHTLAEVLSEGNTSGGTQIDMESTKIINVADPTNDQDVVTKSYADAIEQGLDTKDSVRLATDGQDINLTATTFTGSIDGTSLNTGDRVLLKDQTNAAENGLYLVDSPTDPSTWDRTEDANSDSEVTSGLFTFVEEGSTNAHAGFLVTTDDPIAVDSTDINFTQFSGAGQITAGTGMTKSGNTLNVNAANASINANANDLGVNVGTGIEINDPNGVRLATQGNGIAGGAGSLLSVDPTDASIVVGSSGVGVGIDASGGSVATTGDFNNNPLSITNQALQVAVDNSSIVVDSNNALSVDTLDGGTF